MKNTILLTLACLLMCVVPVSAQKKISDYPNTATPNPADLFILARAGVSNYNITAQQLYDWQVLNLLATTVTNPMSVTIIGAKVASDPISPTPATVSIAAANTSYQLAVTNSIRLLNVLNTNAGTIYLMCVTNGGYRLPIAQNATAQWSAPEGMVTPGTSFWFLGTTGLVQCLVWY